MSKKKNDIFWISYADLMTSLFFVVLALFVIVFVLMQNEQNKLKLKLAEYEKIKELKSALASLDTNYFAYDPVNKRHELRTREKEMFYRGKSVIKDSVITSELIAAGKSLKNITLNLKDTSDVKYLIILEGMAAKYMKDEDLWRNSDPGEINFTYILSYKRAKAIYELWENAGIDFDSERFEIILAGSGWAGTGRYNQDFNDQDAENANKRILVQIIPKVGEIKVD